MNSLLTVLSVVIAVPVATGKCSDRSSVACFHIKVQGDSGAQFKNVSQSEIPVYYDHGVIVQYISNYTELFGSVWDSSADKFVNVTSGRGGYCIFDMGATEWPEAFLKLYEQHGLSCQFTFKPPTGYERVLTYNLTVQRHEGVDVDCQSWPYGASSAKKCPQPPQPFETQTSADTAPIEYVHFPAPAGYCSQLPAAWTNRTGWSTPKEAYDRLECSVRNCGGCAPWCDPACPSADKQWLPGTCASAGKELEVGWSGSKDPAKGCTQWCHVSGGTGGSSVGGGTKIMV